MSPRVIRIPRPTTSRLTTIITILKTISQRILIKILILKVTLTNGRSKITRGDWSWKKKSVRMSIDYPNIRPCTPIVLHVPPLRSIMLLKALLASARTSRLTQLFIIAFTSIVVVTIRVITLMLREMLEDEEGGSMHSLTSDCGYWGHKFHSGRAIRDFQYRSRD